MFRTKRSAGEIHLHFDPFSIFHNRPILFANGNLPTQSLRKKIAAAKKYHETIRRTLPRIQEGLLGPSLDEITDNIYPRLLFPFVDVFCFFSAVCSGTSKN